MLSYETGFMNLEIKDSEKYTSRHIPRFFFPCPFTNTHTHIPHCHITLQILMGMARLFAPVTPFFSEYVYNNLRIYHKDHKNESLALDHEFRSPSVHYLMIPETDESLIDTSVEVAIDLMQRIVESARNLRTQDKLSLKLPLKQLLVVGDQKVLDSIKSVESIILTEVNVDSLELSSKDEEWSRLTAKPDFKALPREFISIPPEFKKKKKKKKKGKDDDDKTPTYTTLPDAIKALSSTDVARLQKEGSLKVTFGLSNELEHVVDVKHVEMIREFKGDTKVSVFERKKIFPHAPDLSRAQHSNP